MERPRFASAGTLLAPALALALGACSHPNDPNPHVVSITPAPMATDVPIDTPVSVSFDKTVYGAIDLMVITVRGPDGSPIDGTSVMDAERRTFTFVHGPLAYDTAYEATLDYVPVADGHVTWSFTTVADPAPPSVVAFDPPEGGRLVPCLAGPLLVTFSERMDPATLDGAIRLVAHGQPVSGKVVYDPGGRTASFNPGTDLEPATDYTLSVSTLAHDRSGAALAASRSATFRTASIPQTIVAPGVASHSSPAVAVDGAGNALAVWYVFPGSGYAAVVASRFDAASGAWSAEHVLERVAVEGIPDEPPRVSSNGGGFAAFWKSPDLGLAAAIWSGGTWSPPTSIAPVGAMTRLVVSQIVSDGTGYAITWQDAASLGTWLRVFDGAAWEDPVLVADGGVAYNRGFGGLTSTGARYGLLLFPRVEAGSRAELWERGPGETRWTLSGVRERLDPASSVVGAALLSNGTSFLLAIGEQFEALDGSFTYVLSAVEMGSAAPAGATEQVVATGPDLYRGLMGASNGSGYALAWKYWTAYGAWDGVTAAVFDGTSWSVKGLVPSADSGSAELRSIASNGTGYAVTWVNAASSLVGFYAAVQSAGTWSGPTLLAQAQVEPGKGVPCGQAVRSGSDYLVLYAFGGAVSIATSSGNAWVTELLRDAADDAYPVALASRGPYAVAYWQQSARVWARAKAPAGWTTASLAPGAAGSASDPRVVPTAQGTLVLWMQYDAGIDHLYAALETGGAFGAPTRISLGANVRRFDVAVKDGTAVVVWAEGYADTYARRLGPDGWSVASHIYPGAVDCWRPSIVAGADGWLVGVLCSYFPYSARSADGLSWGALEMRGSSQCEDVRAVEAPGGYVLFLRRVSTWDEIWATAWDGTAWSTASLLAPGGSDRSLLSEAAAFDGASTMYAWIADDGVRAAHYDGAGWSASELVGPDISGVPALAAGAEGFLLAWETTSGDPRWSTYGGSGWSAPASMPSGPAPDRIAAGGATYAGVGRLPGGGIASRCRAGGAWSSARRLVVDGADVPELDIAWDGTSYSVAWTQALDGAMHDTLRVMTGM